jgi:3-phosphoshikimate 1-carboxyvinyltransferase
MPPPTEALRQPLERLPPVLAVPCAAARRAPVVFDTRPPGSKSLTNRALLLAALASGESTITNALTDADDTRRMIDALRVLGADIRPGDREPGVVRVWGLSGKPRASRAGTAGPTLNLGNAGTATRFLAAAAMLADAPVTIDGTERMRQRPIGDLGDALASLGCTVEYLGAPGCPPLRITPPARAVQVTDRTVSLASTASSQFISALLLAGAFLPGGLTVKVAGEVTSPSYIRMTLWLLARLGASVQSSDDLRVLRVRGVGRGVGKDDAGLASFRYEVEPDASAATYFLGAAALLPGVTCRVLGLSHASVQGDAKFAGLLARMGAVTQHEAGAAAGPKHDAFIAVTGAGPIEPILADMSDMPDAAMTLASVACFAPGGTSILRGLRTLRVKETDRIEALRTELTKLGVRVENPVAGDDGAVTITPPTGGVDCSPRCPRVEFETYDDHRMAMALSLIALRRPHTYIKNPRCVEKTYPTYWRDLADLLDSVGSR